MTPSKPFLLPALLILLLAILYRIYLHDILAVLLGFGRIIQPLSDFPYDFHRVTHPLLSGCEDIWLDASTRKLFATCGDIRGRKGWCPGASKLDVSARRGSGWIAVLDIDQPGKDGLYGVRKVRRGEEDYTGELDLLGFDAKRTGDDGVVRFWLINHRPPVDGQTGEIVKDAESMGANSTIEVFDLDGTETLRHVKTIVSDAIISPNNLVLEGDGNAFLVTNDHTRKHGVLKTLELLTGGGSVARCETDSGQCVIADDKGFYMTNGITRGHDGLVYVVHAGSGIVSVHELGEGGELRRIGEIQTGIVMDNLSLDAEGNVIVAGIPDLVSMLRAFEREEIVPVPATILRMKKTGEAKYQVDKMVEDKEGSMLSGPTVAVHDVPSKRLFAAGILSPHITICQRR